MMSAANTVEICGKDLELAPLTFGALKRLSGCIRGLTLGEFTTSEALFGAMASLVHASLARRNPDLTLEQVEEDLDWRVAKAAVEQLMAMSFPQAPAGEPVAESPSGSSTGMPASPN